jgi:predicted lipoprotein with Yx(FWY)xxD motif
MPRPTNSGRARRLPRAAIVLVAGLTGFALAAIAGIAAASAPFTLKVQKNTHVTNAAFSSFRVRAVDKREAVAVGRSGYAVYTFQGETTRHIICRKTGSQSTNCWGFWPPVTVKSAKGLSAQTGIKGKLGAFHNHGVLQLTLNRQPVYYFTPDLMSGHKGTAQGDELRTFGSIWHIVTADPAVASAPSTTGSTTTSTTTSPNPYPSGYTY